MTGDERSTRYVFREKGCLGSGLSRSEGALLLWLSSPFGSGVTLIPHSGLSEPSHQIYVENVLKIVLRRQQQCLGGGNSLGPLKRQHERRRNWKRKGGTKTKGHSSKYSGIEVN